MGISKGLFTQTFIPQTVSQTGDGVGGFTTTLTNGAAFRGRLSGLPVNERLMNDKTTVYASHKIYCDYASTITEATRIINSTSSRVFEVRGIVNPSDINHHMEITVLELR